MMTGGMGGSRAGRRSRTPSADVERELVSAAEASSSGTGRTRDPAATYRDFLDTLLRGLAAPAAGGRLAQRVTTSARPAADPRRAGIPPAPQMLLA